MNEILFRKLEELLCDYNMTINYINRSELYDDVEKQKKI